MIMIVSRVECTRLNQMENQQCSSCHKNTLTVNETLGFIVCSECGAVNKEYILVAQQQFQETSGGISAVGQHVGEGRVLSHF